MHRPEIVGEDGTRKTQADFYHRKARFEELGHPCKLQMDLNLGTGAYESVDYRQW
jgi:twinkle protein